MCLSEILQGRPCRDEGMTKILQTELTFAILVEVHGRWKLMSWKVPTPLLAMSGSSADCYWRCVHFLLSLLDIDGLAKDFKRVQRLSLTDGDAACEKFERVEARVNSLQYDRWSTMRTGPGDAHTSQAQCQRRQLQLPG